MANLRQKLTFISIQFAVSVSQFALESLLSILFPVWKEKCVPFTAQIAREQEKCVIAKSLMWLLRENNNTRSQARDATGPDVQWSVRREVTHSQN
jgi:hypothetical protein